MTKHYIELEPVQTQYMQVLSVMLEHKLEFNSKGPIFTRSKDGIDYEIGLKEEEILTLCQISQAELDKILFENRVELIELNKKFYWMSNEDLNPLMDGVISFLAQSDLNLESISAEQVLQNHNGMFEKKYLQRDLIDFALSLLGEKMRRSYKILKSKVKKRIGKLVMLKEPVQKLNDFVNTIKQAFEVYLTDKIPNDEEDASFKPQDNLFEGFKDFNLSFMKGMAVIIPMNLQEKISEDD